MDTTLTNTAPRPVPFGGWLIPSWLLFASFTFYVTFVQYALLRRAETTLGLSERDLLPGMALLGLGGIVASLATGWHLDRRRPSLAAIGQWVALASGALAAVAVLALQAESALGLNLVFLPMGLLLGGLIVSLLQLFSELVPARMRGLLAGGVAGASYFLANIMATLSHRPDIIGLIDIALLGGNVVCLLLFGDLLAEMPRHWVGHEQTPAEMLVRLWPLAVVVLVDTALFVLVTRAPGAKPVFAGPGDWVSNGVGHLLAALVAGALYARMGWRRTIQIAGVALAALVALFVAHRIGAGDLGDEMIFAYSVVVGFYTVGLFTVFGEETPRARPAVGIAAGIVLVGWLGSPAGIALGEALRGWLS